MIGTNYRIFDKWQPSITQEWRQHENYWQGKPFISRWHYPMIPEYANRYAQFVTKHVISFSPTAQDALNMRRDAPEAIMVGGEISRTSFQRMSIGRYEALTSPWKDERIRIALRRAVDWEGITSIQTNREAFAAAGIDVETSMATHAPYDPDFWLDPRKGELGPTSENYRPRCAS
jgi:ABC-type transport system substrate-binding protein